MVLPVVLTLIMGIMEFGFLWKDSLTISNAIRAGARVGAADGNTANAANPDFDILTAVKAASTALPANTIQFVTVYKASATDASLPAGCDTASQAGICNYYSSAVVNAALLASDFGGNVGDKDLSWNPQTRKVCLSGSVSVSPPDYLGVYIRVNHQYVTKILGSSRTLSDKTVMRLEPQC